MSIAILVSTLAVPARSQDALATASKSAAAIVKDFKGRNQSQRAFVASPKPTDTLHALLARCTQAERRSFLGSLAFVNGEVASAQISDVEKCLGEDGLSRLPASFGVLPGALYNNKKCQSNECEVHKGSNCTSNCGKLPCRNNCGADLTDSSAGARTSAVSLGGFFTLEEALAGCGEDASNRFLDSIVFAAGRPAQANLSLLSSCGKARVRDQDR